MLQKRFGQFLIRMIFCFTFKFTLLLAYNHCSLHIITAHSYEQQSSYIFRWDGSSFNFVFLSKLRICLRIGKNKQEKKKPNLPLVISVNPVVCTLSGISRFSERAFNCFIEVMWAVAYVFYFRVSLAPSENVMDLIFI